MISALVLSGSRDASSWESRGMGARKINITRTKAKVLLTKKPPFGIPARLLFHVPLVDLQLRTRRRHVIKNPLTHAEFSDGPDIVIQRDIRDLVNQLSIRGI